ncbi:uncharacterized protein, partial [Palaemon carinicauda]|uniref:uncharacterized protein n=1 Tax=Palaemon carinicauda TaxID=392227 RepID=UPI0035B68128
RGCKTAFVLRLATLYSQEKACGHIYHSLNRPYDRVGYVLGMTAGAVRVTVNCASSSVPSPSSGSQVPPVFHNFTIGAIRHCIYRKFAEKEHFTVGSLTNDLKTAGIIPEMTSWASILRLLHSMGFKYRTSQRKMYVRKESLEIVWRRITGLCDLRRQREERRVVVYVDETWFTTRMAHNREWADTTQEITSLTYSRQVPPGEGERFVVVAAGTNEGFIDGSYLCYLAKTNQGDYHGEMNAKLFKQWLTTQLLPYLPEPSVLVLDNAPYHSTLLEESRCPTSATKKADLYKWLEQRRISFRPSTTRSELLLICQKNRPERRYETDNSIREWGHEVVGLPPAHPELNAIEQVWGFMKRHIRSSLRRFTRSDLQDRLEEARLSVTPEVWSEAVRQSRHFEEGYWESDNIRETVEPVINSLSSDNEDGEDDLFLESDDDCIL